MGNNHSRSRKKEVLVALGSRVRAARLERGWTQEDVASRLGISVAYLSLIERGDRNPPYTTALQIARALHVAPQEFFAS